MTPARREQTTYTFITTFPHGMALPNISIDDAAIPIVRNRLEIIVTETSAPATHQADWAPVLIGQSLLFGLLGKLLYSNPARDWVEPLALDNLFEEAPFAAEQESTQRALKLLGEWSADVAREGLTEAMLEDLRVDYTRIFVGHRRMDVPAWESVYFNQERLTFQEETVSVRRWFDRFGVKPGINAREPEDHIAFELSFVGHLAEQAANALDAGDGAAFTELLAAQREFLSDHLLRWGWKWTELALEQAQTNFYQGLALLVQGGLFELSALYDVPIDWEIRFPGLGA